MHWYISVRILLRATSCSMLPPSPSAKPLSKSRATIMKSLSGASYWSGWALCNCNKYAFSKWALVILRSMHKKSIKTAASFRYSRVILQISPQTYNFTELLYWFKKIYILENIRTSIEKYHGLCKGLLHQIYTTLVHGFTVWKKARLQGSSNWRQALEIK